MEENAELNVLVQKVNANYRLDTEDLIGPALLNSINRAAEVTEIARQSIVLVHDENGPRVCVEYCPHEGNKLSQMELAGLWESIAPINDAIDAGLVRLTPGISTLELIDREAAIKLLAPNYFDFDVISKRDFGPGINPLATITSQWIPPGIGIELTRGETKAILTALLVGLPAVRAALKGIVAAGPVAIAIAAAIVVGALAFAAAAIASDKGAVKIKYVPVPPAGAVIFWPA